MISQLGQIALVFHDVPAATRFYRDTLGLKFLFAPSPDLAFFDCGGVMIMFTRAERPEFDHANNVLYLAAPDIHSAHAALLAKGVRFEDGPKCIAKLPTYDLWMAFFRDPENNLLALRAEVKNT